MARRRRRSAAGPARAGAPPRAGRPRRRRPTPMRTAPSPLPRSTSTAAIPRSRSRSRRALMSLYGAISTPRTRCSSKRSSSALPRLILPAVPEQDGDVPGCPVLAPRTTSVKNGFRPSSTTKPTLALTPAAAAGRRRCARSRALRSPGSLDAASAETSSGRFSTFETVPTDTPASGATSRMLPATCIPSTSTGHDSNTWRHAT